MPGTPGQPVRRVAAHRGEVGVRPPRDPVLGLAPPRRRAPRACATPTADVQHPHAAPASSTSWTRSRSPLTTSTGPGPRGGEGADHVVGLEPVDADPGDAEGRQHVRRSPSTCGARLVGLLLDVGPRVGSRPRAGAPCTTARARPGTPAASRRPSRPPAVGAGAPDQRRDHVEEAADRVDRQTVGRAERVGHPVERAEVHRRGVEQEQPSGTSWAWEDGSAADVLPRRA